MTGHTLRRYALAMTLLCICLLPASNTKLPCSTQPLIGWLVGCAWICWLISRLMMQLRAQAHERAMWAWCVIVCLTGWVMALCPRAMVDPDSGIILALDKSAWLSFGTIDQAVSVKAMLSMTTAIALLMMTCDFAAERGQRVALAFAITVSGAIAVIFGFALRGADEMRSLWMVPHVPDSVFGMFWYHGNAGAFLNLCWPMTLWLCVTLLQRGTHVAARQWMLVVLLQALLAQIVAVMVNVSKMGHLMFILQAALLLGFALVFWRRNAGRPASTRRLLLMIMMGVVFLGLVSWIAGAGDGFRRWSIFASRSFDDPARRLAALMAVKIGWDNLWTGTGPGTFEFVAAHYSTLVPVLAAGRWRHAHNDYTEFFAEWGLLGALLMLFAAGWFVRRAWDGVRAALSPSALSFQRRSGVLCSFASASVTLLHAFVDFPLQIEATRNLFAVLLGLFVALTAATRRAGTFRLSEE